jgi:biotin carboxyl carrier protein
MKREFTITLDDVEYPAGAEGEKITVNGRPFTVEVTEDGTVLVDGIAYDITLEGDTATAGKRSYKFQVAGLTPGGAALSPIAPSAAVSPPDEAGAGAVQAIMPGKIVRVLVEPGQQVEEGQAVCVLEAMKMENELQAPLSGTVRAVHVEPGGDVEKSQVLVEIE